ncbi:MAG: class I SAM-dependent methyltransferase [Candidatus Nanoarchaeia archaeon]|jgi:SAM-dependent methyltransferase
MSLLKKMFEKAAELNKKNILLSLERNPRAKLLDLGCDDGDWSLVLAKKIGTKRLYGIDIVSGQLRKADKKGLITKKADLNKKFPFKNNSFDVVHANQVIEHISDLDNFVSEVYRILKPGGYVVISTENASSWHNIFASIMGWQIFSLTNISKKALGIGNPLAVLKGEKIGLVSWTHKTILNYRGLKELFILYNFNKIKMLGAGYYPLPTKLGCLDPRHAHFITLVGRKPNI